jgi:death on curing protein
MVSGRNRDGLRGAWLMPSTRISSGHTAGHTACATRDLAECAAAYGFGIAKNHAFVDANKRTAFQIMYVSLGLNGRRLVVTETEIVALMINVASDAIDEAELARWIRAHTTAR